VPKFDANLTLLYTELDFMDRFAAAAADGFTGVEYLFPYAFDKKRLAEQLRAANLEQVLFNLPAGDWAAGERGIACHPDRTTEFREGVSSAIDYAQALSCTRVNCLAGKIPAGVSHETARKTFVENLRFAAPALERAGVTLLIEPINTYDIPGFFLSGTAPALEIIEEVGSRNLQLQYDVYHMQRTEGELAATLTKHLASIAHIQIADNPGRHEPGTGEINYQFLFEHIDRSGYKGWIGCEYIPLAKTSEGLGWWRRHE
jgi:hydroxypyruvate isomerase